MKKLLLSILIVTSLFGIEVDFLGEDKGIKSYCIDGNVFYSIDGKLTQAYAVQYHIYYDEVSRPIKCKNKN